MSKKQLENRLEDLFAEIEETARPAQEEAVPTGQVTWTWETDSEGIYTACGNEVADLLGMPSSLFVGHSVFTFGLDQASEARMHKAFDEKKFPCQVRVEFQAPGSATRLVIFTIQKNSSQSGLFTGFSGFGKVVQDSLAASKNAQIKPKPQADPVGTKPLSRTTGPLPPGVVKRGKTRELKGTHELPRIAQKKEPISISGTRVRLTHDGSVLSIDLNIPEEGLRGFEFVDHNENRIWSEEDRLLVEEVTRQLFLAIENARLYEAAQNELNERIMAEEEIMQRNQDLGALNEIGQQLSRLTEETSIFATLRNTLSDLVDTSNLIVGLLDSQEKKISYPVYTLRGETRRVAPTPLQGDIFGYVIKNQISLYIPTLVGETLSHYEVIPPNPVPASLIAVPLISAGKASGAILLQDFESDYAFDEKMVDLLSTISSQIAIALENSRAYQLTQQAYEEIREVDRMKSQFLANMSHELRTPLNSIIGFSRVILKEIDGPINDTQKQDLTSIYSSGQHLLSLINNVLDLSKIEAGKMELQFEEVNLVDIIKSVMSTGVGLVKDKPIKLVQKIEPGLPSLMADQTRIRQVLLNLLSNAAKFTEEGSITVSAKVEKGPQGTPVVLVTFTDTGAGIAEKDRAKLFQPFSQVDDSPTRKTGGTGLGLSICRSFIEMHGGQIGLLSSEEGKGSTFYFTLPIQRETAPEAAPERPQEVSQGEKVILAIDDDSQVISLYERFLQPSGYKVISLTQPQSAVEKVKEIKPYAVTLDVMMPSMDGWQVLHDLKADRETRNVPVIICSILEDEEKGLGMGASDYLVKPFLQEDLVNAIAGLNHEGGVQHVLIVDDNDDDRALIQKSIRGVDHFEVLSASNGKQAMMLLNTIKPDVIILDLFMPEMNGFDFLEKMRAETALYRIPVIILTSGDLSPEDLKRLGSFSQHLLNKSILREKEFIYRLEEVLKTL